MQKILVALSLSLLAGCAGNQAEGVLAALAKDTAAACVSINNAFPPYAGSATFCRTNGNSDDTVSIDKNGVVSITRGAPKAP